jgi:imidazolonepropionase-like amidohydrolase
VKPRIARISDMPRTRRITRILDMAPITRITRLLVLVLSLAAGLGVRQSVNPIVSTFSLHKYQMKVGDEVTQTLENQSGSRTTFALSYLGTNVKFESSSSQDDKGLPKHFTLKGDTSTQSHVDYEVTVDATTITMRDGTKTTTAARPPFFVINAGYAPFATQQAALTAWRTHGRPAEIPGFPIGPVRIEPRGRGTYTLAGKPVTFDRYTFTGFTWGRLVAWAGDDGQLVASLGEDAEFDRFEAVRPGYEPLLPAFSKESAEIALAAMEPVTRELRGPAVDRIAIVNGRLWDGTGAPAIPDAAVVISSGRITATGPRSTVRIPGGARVIDANGGTILPGLWEMHAHYAQAELGPAYLAAGITTVRDAGNDADFVVPIRDAIDSGRLIGARMLLAGYVDGVGASGLGIMRASGPDEGRALVQRYAARRFQQIKIYGNAQLNVETVRAITDEAHKLGMTVTGHIPRGMNALQAVEQGYDQINHLGSVTSVLRARGERGAPPAPLDLDADIAKSAIRTLAARGIVVDPSFARGEYNSHDITRPFVEVEPAAAKAPRPLAEIFDHTGVAAAAAERARQGRKATSGPVLVALYRGGVPIVAGIDLVVPGHSLHRELEHYVEAGLTPAEALATTTRMPAKAMRSDKDLGTIEAGKLGNVVIVAGNPLERIGDLRQVRTVVADGRIYDPVQLWKAIGFRP